MPIVKFWTPEKLEIIKEKYSTADLTNLAEELGCSIAAMQKQASKLKITKSHPKGWSIDEINYLKTKFAKTDNDELSKHLSKSASAIRTYAQKLGLKKANNYWKIGQEKYVLENYGKITIKEMQEYLKKTKWGIINKHRELAGKRKTGDKVIESKISKDGLAK